MNLLGHGVYNIAEAARFTGLKKRRVKDWFQGRATDPFPRTVFQGDYKVLDGFFSISFLDLVEVFIAGQLRESGVSLARVRRAHVKLQGDWGIKHPFSKKDIRTDGKDIFICALDEEDRAEVIDVITNNRVFERIIVPVLEKMDYDLATALALKWHISKGVVIDPDRCFGKPIVERAGITTNVLASSYYGNRQDAKTVARWYGVSEEDVMDAVRFESEFAA